MGKLRQESQAGKVAPASLVMEDLAEPGDEVAILAHLQEVYMVLAELRALRKGRAEVEIREQQAALALMVNLALSI
jgi:hypothetical protein